jgi:hypothetical protein
MSHQNSLHSMVSNPFNIKIIEDGEQNEFILKKSRNSSLKLSIEKSKKKDENHADTTSPNQGSPGTTLPPSYYSNIYLTDRSKASNNSGQDGGAPNEPEKSEEPQPPTKKKKKVIKKKKKKVEEEVVVEVDGKGDQGIDPKATEATAVTKPTPSDTKESIQLHGISHIGKPVDLDKLLLSDQTNGILTKGKKKKIKKKKTKKMPENDDGKVKSENLAGIVVGESHEVGLNGSGGSSKNTKDGESSENSARGSSRIGSTKPISEMSGKKELNQLKGVRGKSTPKNSQKSSKISNASVIDGGDMDVNSFIKNMKQIEDEKNQAKRELMNSSKKKNK